MGSRVLAARGAAALGLFFSSLVWSQSTPPPVVTLTTTSNPVAAGKTARISWTSTNADRCVGSGGWSQVYEGTTAKSGSFTTPVLTERTNTFVLTCSGAGGSSQQTLTITALPKPEVTLRAEPDRALPGGSVVLSWQSTDAMSCSASGAPFTGTKTTSGSEALSALTKGTKKFSLSCKGVGGTTKVTSEVAVVPAPTLTFSARSNQVPENGAAQLKWKATDATSCIASGNWSGEQKLSGSLTTSALTSDQTYTLTCTGPNGEAEETVTVEVVAAPIVTLELDQEVIAPGESVGISWDVSDAQSCKASGSPFTGDKDINGGAESLENLTKGNKIFKLTCKGGGGTTTVEARLTVIAKPTLTFSASADEVAEGASARITWKSTDALTCVAGGDWSGDRGVSGSYETGALSSNKTYSLACQGLNGQISKALVISVRPAPVITLKLSTEISEPGQAVMISWSAENARQCDASDSGWTGKKSLTGSESVVYADQGLKVFTLTCSGVGGVRSATVRLSVMKTFSLVLEKIGPGGGQVNSDVQGIDCGSLCAARFAAGTQIKLTATSDNRSSFKGWSGACGGNSECSLTLDSSKTVRAEFLNGRPTDFLLTLTSIPSSVSRLMIAIDKGSGSVAAVVNQAHDGSSSAVVSLGVSEGNGWRIRVLGLSTKNSFPYMTVAAGGRAEDLQAIKSERVPVTIEMSQPTVEASTPTQVETGSAIAVRFIVNDAADMFDGFYSASTIQLSTQKVLAFGSGISGVSEVILPGPKKIGAGKWEISGVISAPTSVGSLYLRLNSLLGNWRCSGCPTIFPSFVSPGAVNFEDPVEIKVVAGRFIELIVSSNSVYLFDNGGTPHADVSLDAAKRDGAIDFAESVMSFGQDLITGSVYEIAMDGAQRRSNAIVKASIKYLSRDRRVVFRAAHLAETIPPIWRKANGIDTGLPSSAWVAICMDNVWSVQDGYRLITHEFDKALTFANQNDIEIARSAEVSLVTDVGCGTGGALKVSGFVFGVSDIEPSLSAEPVPAHRFEIELSRSGEVLRKTLTPTEFVLPAVCASPENELTQFCTEAKRVVGW
jgi:hypothetical protein